MNIFNFIGHIFSRTISTTSNVLDVADLSLDSVKDAAIKMNVESKKWVGNTTPEEIQQMRNGAKIRDEIMSILAGTAVYEEEQEAQDEK